MLSRIGRQSRRFSQIVKQDAVVPNVIAKQVQPAYEMQEFQHDALKQYFDQDALLYPIEEIIQRVD